MEYMNVMEQFDLISELGLPPSSSSSSSSVDHHGRDNDDSTSPAATEEEVPKPHNGRLFANIDWKTSTYTTTTTTKDPFPDVKIQIVNEIAIIPQFHRCHLMPMIPHSMSPVLHYPVQIIF